MVTPGFAPGVFVRMHDLDSLVRTLDVDEARSLEVMMTSDIQEIHLRNESGLNVATLLQEDVGSTRTVDIDLDSFPLDDDLIARNVDARVRLTRLRHHILADGELRADIELECVRCLTMFDFGAETAFSEQFRQLHDVRSGADLSDHRELEGDDEEDTTDEDAFVIDEHHELDLAEALRQNLVLAIPMTPVCGEECPGPPMVERGDDETEQQGGRFGALASLLDDDTDDASDRKQ